jgi:surface antigen
MLKRIGALTATALLALSFGTLPAKADACSGKSHETGTILGAIGGGLIGNAASNGNAGGVVAGAILGGLAGNAIARDIDCRDRPYAERSYRASFSGNVGRQYGWRNGNNHGYIVSNRQYNRRAEVCRDFTQVTYIGRREIVRHGTACRSRGSDWRIL